MRFSNTEKCKTCLFSWYSSNYGPYCDYFLVTGEKRVNTETECKSYVTCNKRGLNVSKKKEILKGGDNDRSRKNVREQNQEIS